MLLPQGMNSAPKPRPITAMLNLRVLMGIPDWLFQGEELGENIRTFTAMVSTGQRLRQYGDHALSRASGFRESGRDAGACESQPHVPLTGIQRAEPGMRIANGVCRSAMPAAAVMTASHESANRFTTSSSALARASRRLCDHAGRGVVFAEGGDGFRDEDIHDSEMIEHHEDGPEAACYLRARGAAG
jgi:hypothetical protein